MNNPNCGACGMLNSRGFCSLTACRFPVVNGLGTWQERILANKPKQTNADRIRSMTDEELAEWLFQAWHNSWYTLQEWIDWLKSPVEVDNG